MNKYSLAVIALIGLAACSTSGPELGNSGAAIEAADSPGAAEAAEPAATTYAATSPDIADENSVYCRKEKLTGTRIAQVVCMTSAEKERVREVSRMNVDSAKRSAGAVPQNN